MTTNTIQETAYRLYDGAMEISNRFSAMVHLLRHLTEYADGSPNRVRRLALKPVVDYAQVLAHGTEVMLTAADHYGAEHPDLAVLRNAPQILRDIADELETPTGNRYVSHEVLASVLDRVARLHAASERFFDWTDDEVNRVTVPGVDRF